MQDELREVRRQLARTRQPLEVIEEVEEKVEELQDTVVAPIERRASEASISPVRRAIRLGDKVRMHSLNTQGVVDLSGRRGSRGFSGCAAHPGKTGGVAING